MSDCALNQPCGITSEMLEGVASLKESVTSSSGLTSKTGFAPRNYLHTLEQIARELRVDEDGNLWWRKQNAYNRRNMSKPCGVPHVRGYALVTLDKEKYRAHVLAFCLYHGRWPAPGTHIDHINGNSYDNRKANLREVTPAENQRNRGDLNKNNTTGINGVCWDATRGKWKAQIRYAGRKYQKRFDFLAEAIEQRTSWEEEFGYKHLSMRLT